MSDSEFFRIELDWQKVSVPYLEVHQVRRDILLYFDENVGEAIHILMPLHIYKLDYWKYLSLGYEKRWAESERYRSLIERGCLAIINGITLEILYEISPNTPKIWSERKIGADTILPYVKNYVPSCAFLADAKSYLLKKLHFINELSEKDFDEYGELKYLDDEPAIWFDKNIVQQYYREMVADWCE